MYPSVIANILLFCDASTASALRQAFPCLFVQALRLIMRDVRLRYEKKKMLIEILEQNSSSVQKSISALWAIASLSYVDTADEDNFGEEFDAFDEYFTDLKSVDAEHTETARELVKNMQTLMCSDVELKVMDTHIPRLCSCRRIVEGHAVRMRDLVFVLIMESAPARRVEPSLCCSKLRRIVNHFKRIEEFRCFYDIYEKFFGRAHTFIKHFLKEKASFERLEEQLRMLRFLSRLPILA